MNRRQFLATTSLLMDLRAAPAPTRRYHVCLAPDILERSPELISVVRDAGVSTVWLAGFLYGHWYYTPERIKAVARKVRAAGLKAEGIVVPLGHPGDSLGAKQGEPPLTPPPHWRQCIHADGTKHWGTSLHAPATEENAAALQRLDGLSFRAVFLDDDFRLATGPGAIGGCFCAEHWQTFAKLHGYDSGIREQIAADAKARVLSPQLKSWVDFHCDELTRCFRSLEKARPDLQLGNMVMYLGSEKAGIRLSDYRHAPVRVGELMFNDRSFDTAKGKTDELFSVLFHRRYVKPELAFSETTAFPADRLSAANMAAKLAVSTLCDVRNTMFMSGLTPFPASHWQTLGPAMKQQATIHEQVAGHRPEGPLKHYWGEHSRYVGEDKPFSLFLAMGVPFEVCDMMPSDGWTFLSDADAGAQPQSAGTELVSRRDVPETLEGIFAMKRRIRERLTDVPYLEQDEPAVCSWLRSAGRVLVWNLASEKRTLTLRFGERRVPFTAGPLELVSLAV